MFPQFRCALRATAGIAVLASATTAPAQWIASSNACGCARPVPVVQQCYQQVPVTEYQQVKQKVRRPETYTEYIEQPVVTYRPVTETRTRDVPVTTYQNVSECRTVTRNTGHWQTNYIRTNKVAPCAYDPRPSVFGWLNRTAYSIRSTFTPDYIAQRQYVPQQVAMQVPVTRRVPITTVQKQTYQVTKYVKEESTRRVAVNKVRWVEDTVTALKPVTVVKTVPVTRTAWGWAPMNTTTAILPSTTRTSLAPQADPSTQAGRSSSDRTANRPINERSNDATDSRSNINRINRTPLRRSAVEPADRITGQRSEIIRRPLLFEPVSRRSRSAATIARVGGWRASQSKPGQLIPILPPPGVTIADAR